MNVNGNNRKAASGTYGANNTGKTLIEALQSQIKEIERALPKHVTADRVSRIVMTALRANPKLGECEKMSFLGAVMLSAQLGLEVNTPLGQSYLIPRWNSNRQCVECNFQLGYFGLIELAYRTGKYKRINAFAVYPEDEFSFAYGLDTELRHKPATNRREESEPNYYYAVYKLENGGDDFRAWSKSEVMNHAKKYSKSWDATKGRFAVGSSWATAFNAMAKKTVLVDLLKYAPKSVELQQAISADESKVSFATEGELMTFDTTYEEPERTIATLESNPSPITASENEMERKLEREMQEEVEEMEFDFLGAKI